MMKKLASVIILFIFLIPGVVLSQGTTQDGSPSNTTDQEGTPGPSISLTNPLCDESVDPDNNCLLDAVGNVIAGLVQLAVPVVVIMVLVGGFQMLLAGGDPQKFTAGRKTVMYAAIGFLVIIMARGVSGILQSLFG